MSKNMEAREHATDLLPAFALGCLDGEDLVWVTDHLMSCAECQAELEAYYDVTSGLAQAVAPVEPGQTAKTRLLERIRSCDSAAADAN